MSEALQIDGGQALGYVEQQRGYVVFASSERHLAIGQIINITMNRVGNYPVKVISKTNAADFIEHRECMRRLGYEPGPGWDRRTDDLFTYWRAVGVD